VRLLLTRPESDAQRTAASLRALGHETVIAPLLRIAVAADAEIGPGPWAAILITSVNAARAIATHTAVTQFHALPVFAVGQRSAQAMAAAGFADVSSADGGVAELAHLAAARVASGASLLYLAGEDRSGDLAGDLGARGFAVQTAVIYRAVAAASLPRVAAEALAGGVEGVLHFSRRSAEAYVDAARSTNMLAAALKPVQYCISAEVAEPLLRAGAADTRAAPEPSEAALIGLIDPA
jgi:uroporphyrinogen-III synthase